MSTDQSSELRSKGPSPAERAWRQALRAAGYQVAPTSVHVHPSQLNNPLADKRAAEEAYRAFVAAEPDNLMALDGLAFLLQHRGVWPEALQLRRQRYAVEARELGVPEDKIPEVVGFLAASLGDGEAPSAAPTAYIEKMFDDIADEFDRLVRLQLYRGPELLWDAVATVLEGPPLEVDVLDLGCGTGLAGSVFRSAARSLTGVDLSPRMLARARERGIYDRLTQAEIVRFLVDCDRQFDLIVAADVLIYLGDLSALFAHVADRLRPGGLFAVTAERGEEDRYRLRGTRGYQHSRGYLERVAADAGLALCHMDEVELRREVGEPVRAWRGVWRTST